MNSFEKKNIIFITNLHLWSLETNKGGKAFYSTVNGYINSCWNVVIISTGGGIPKEIHQKAIVYEKKYSFVEKLGSSSFRLISFIERLLKLFLNNRYYYRKAKQIINQIGCKNIILYAYEVEGVISAKKLAKEFDIPLIIRFQGTILANVNDTLINRIRRYPHFSALKVKADLVIMTNDGTQGDQVLKRLGNKSRDIVFWRNGVDGLENVSYNQNYLSEINKFEFLSQEKFIFLTVSRLVDWKRVHLAIEGLARICLDFPLSRLIIVGDGPEMGKLVELSKSLNIESQITFKGAIQQSDIKDIMSNCNAFLSFYDLSNLGNPIMEAMIAGLPIITIDVGDTKELIKDNYNGMLIPSDKLDLIPIYMEKVLVDPELRNRLSLGALLTAQKEFISWRERIDKEVLMAEKLIKLS
jgi:glycosyltransferase involved in cell wall biosynthesis